MKATNQEFRKWLSKHQACDGGMKEVAEQTPEQFYNSTERGDWLLWWILRGVREGLEGYPTLHQLRVASIEIAKLSLHHYKKDDRLKELLQLVEKYVNGDTAIDIVLVRNELNSIRNAAAYAADADADAAYAAYAAADAAAYAAAARLEARKKIAEIVRKHCPITF